MSIYDDNLDEFYPEDFDLDDALEAELDSDWEDSDCIPLEDDYDDVSLALEEDEDEYENWDDDSWFEDDEDFM